MGAHPTQRAIAVAWDYQSATVDGCTYRLHVTGRVTETRSSAGTEGYAPDLRVQTALRCGDGRASSDTVTLRTPAVLLTRLEQQIEALGTVTVEREQSKCSYLPSLAISPWQLRAGALTRQCALPRTVAETQSTPPRRAVHGGGP